MFGEAAQISHILLKAGCPSQSNIMPTVLITGPYRFYFWSYDCRERQHVHVKRDNQEAKFWLDAVELAYNRGFSTREIKRIERIIQENTDHLRTEWDRHCDGADG